MKKGDKLFKLYCNEGDPTLKATKHNNYNKARNSVIPKIKELKKNNYQEYFQKYSAKVKKDWDGIKSVVTIKAKPKSLPNALILNGIAMTNKKAFAETFYNFFCQYWSQSCVENSKNKI